MTDLTRLHRRLLTTLGVAALVAFVSGAGWETPMALVAGAGLLLSMVWEPSPRTHLRLEWLWRALAVALTVRAAFYVLTVPEDVVIPMVDVLLALLASEAVRPAETTDRTRMYTLSFALMIAAAAYRAGVAFGIAFVVYSTVATVSLMVGHMVREAQRFGTAPPTLSRGFLLRIAAFSSVMLFMSGLLFIAFPRVTRSWVTRGSQPSGAIVGFSDRVSLADHGGRIYPNPEVVLRVEFFDQIAPAGRALYWRGRSYDFFDGVGWWHSPRARALSVSTQQYVHSWPRPRLAPKIYAVALDLPILFSLHPTVHVHAYSRMRSMLQPTGDLWYDGVGPPIYRVSAPATAPSDENLRSADALQVSQNSAYLQLPALSPAVLALADSLTRGQATQIDRIRALEGWLRTNFRYTLDLPATAREATLENFLFRRRAGHCEYFSTALVVLLRASGIPARNVNGFLGGDWNQFGNFLTVTQNQAHSWAEVWFPQYGWVAFDATPSATGDVASAQRRWWGPLRFLADGMEHRWNKWVLEYNIEAQNELFRRAVDAVRSPRGVDRSDQPLSMRWLPYALLAFLAMVAFGMWRGRFGTAAPSTTTETRTYMKLRRAYRKAQLEVANEPPLSFALRLRQQGAPGAVEAGQLIELYVRSRFGGEDLGEAGRQRMLGLLEGARAALRAARRAA